MELICVNSTYSEDYLKVFAKNNIKFPTLNEIVELERWEKLPRINKIGYYVKPYTQQFIDGEILGVKGSKEVSFDSKRFTTLLGNEVTEKELQELKEENQGKLEKIIRKETIRELSKNIPK